ALARLLRDRSTPDDRIFIFGSEPQILFYAGRRSASRYVFLYPLFTGGSDAPARQREVTEELRRPPRFVVIVHVAAPFVAAPCRWLWSWESPPRADALLSDSARSQQAWRRRTCSSRRCARS